MTSIAQPVWGLISIVLACVSLIPYLLATIKGTNRPHLFTWLIWTLLTGIAFAIQFLEGAGSGAWSGGISTILCGLIMLASIRQGEKRITRGDWIALISALAAIPLWLLTDNPLLAAVWVTGIDAVGYIPTFRKSWIKPYEEMTMTHAVAAFKHVCVLLAVQNILPATTIYSIGMVAMNSMLVLSIWFRRWSVGRVKTPSAAP